MPERAFRDEIGQKLVAAFDGERGQWRTVGGISRHTGLSEPIVEKYIKDHADFFVRSPISVGGIALYGVRAAL